MIPDFFIGILNGLIGLLPSFDFGLSSFDMSGFFNAMCNVNYYLPVSETFKLVSIVLAYYTFRFLYRTVLWIAERVVV